jgi:hypothetical protein
MQIIPKSRNPEIEKSRNAGIRLSRHPDIQISRNPEIQKSRNPGIQESVHPENLKSRSNRNSIHLTTVTLFWPRALGMRLWWLGIHLQERSGIQLPKQNWLGIHLQQQSGIHLQTLHGIKGAMPLHPRQIQTAHSSSHRLPETMLRRLSRRLLLLKPEAAAAEGGKVLLLLLHAEA